MTFDDEDGENSPISGVTCGCGSTNYYTIDMYEHDYIIDFKCNCHDCGCAFFVTVDSDHDWCWREE